MNPTAAGPGQLSGLLLFIVLAAGALGFPISVAILRFYQRAVLRAMRQRGVSPRSAIRDPQTTHTSLSAPIAHGKAQRHRLISDPRNGRNALLSGSTLFDQLRRGPWRLTAGYALGGLGYATVAAFLFLRSSNEDIRPLAFLLLLWCYLWPLLLAIALIFVGDRPMQLRAAAVYVVGLLTLSVIADLRNPAFSWSHGLVLFATTNLLPTLLLPVFFKRSIRAVGPLVFLFLIVAMAGSQLSVSIVNASTSAQAAAVEVGTTFGLNGTEVFFALMAIGFAILAVVGWCTLQWVRRRYEAMRISDQSLMLDAIWAIFAVINAISMATIGAVWCLLGLLAFVVYKAGVATGFRLQWYDLVQFRPGTSLLVLRVFALGKRSERLFDAVQARWRNVGSIRMIAGPDLATTTIEPHEFLDFLTGHLAERFIERPEQFGFLDLVAQRDFDGRFRVQEFFCYEDVWKSVLAQLWNVTDAVLMDLRGFTRQAAGVTYEFEELLKLVPLNRVVFVADETTDEQYLQSITDECWLRLPASSPNRSADLRKLRIIRLGRSKQEGLSELLRALCAASVAESLVPA